MIDLVDLVEAMLVMAVVVAVLPFRLPSSFHGGYALTPWPVPSYDIIVPCKATGWVNDEDGGGHLFLFHRHQGWRFLLLTCL